MPIPSNQDSIQQTDSRLKQLQISKSGRFFAIFYTAMAAHGELAKGKIQKTLESQPAQGMPEQGSFVKAFSWCLEVLQISPLENLLLNYGGFSAYGLVKSLCKTCAAFKTDWVLTAVLSFPIKVFKVCRQLNYNVTRSQLVYRRFTRLLAANEDYMSDEGRDTFKKVILLQLAFTHLRTSRVRDGVHPLKVTDEEICQVLLRSISDRLVPGHVVWLRVTNYLHEQGLVAGVNVQNRIQHVCLMWRKELLVERTFDHLCLLNFMEVLASTILPSSLPSFFLD